MRLALITFSFLAIFVATAKAETCKAGNWITDVDNDGAVITLSDGTMWLVDEADRIDSNLWLPTENIVVCGSSLMDTDSNDERVTAHPLH